VLLFTRSSLLSPRSRGGFNCSVFCAFLLFSIAFPRRRFFFPCKFCYSRSIIMAPAPLESLIPPPLLPWSVLASRAVSFILVVFLLCSPPSVLSSQQPIHLSSSQARNFSPFLAASRRFFLAAGLPSSWFAGTRPRSDFLSVCST